MGFICLVNSFKQRNYNHTDRNRDFTIVYVLTSNCDKQTWRPDKRQNLHHQRCNNYKLVID